MKKVFFYMCSLLLAAAACNQAPQQQAPVKPVIAAAEEPAPGASIAELDKTLMETDSLVFVFYKDPHGTDSLRYSRYYTAYHTADTGMAVFVKSQLQGPTERFEKVKPCRNEGKIWCFAKGDILQTIYFSDYGADCSFVYIIKNGLFYYSELSKELAGKLKTLKPMATAEANEGE